MTTSPTKALFRIHATKHNGWTLTRNLPRDPAFSAGWSAFDERMRSYDERRLAELQAYRDETRQRADQFGGPKHFTKGNFLRNLIHEASELAFHHGVTGSAQSLAAVRHIVGWLGEEPIWRATSSKTRKADLWTADFATFMGLAYMWTRDALPEETRRRWGEWLMERGIRPLLADWIDPRTRIHALDTMGHNWWSVCVGGAAIALFALRDERPEADEWLRRIGDDFVAFFDYPGNVLQNKHRTFGHQGDFIESIGYLDYTFQNLVLLFELYREVLGRDLAAEIPVLERVCDYYLASVQPVEGRLQRLNFGDMGCGRDTVGAYNHHPTPVWLWLANRFQRGALMEMVRRTHPRPGSFAEFLLWPETPPPGGFETAPGDTVFDNIGVAILRDGYAEDASVFAIKTGEKWNHNQADAGSFILSAKGREFIVDTGVTEYSSPLFLGYFATSHAHNVILHDGRGQRDELGYLGTKFMGTIAGRLFSPGYRYILADATGPWEGVYTRFYRHVLWIGDCIVMIDDLMAGHAAPLTQLLHYRGAASSAEDRTLVENGGKTLKVHHLFPRPERFETRDGHYSVMEPNPLKYEYRVDKWPYLAIHYAAGDRRSKILQVFELPDGATRAVEKWEEPGIHGIRIRTVSEVWTVACNLAADGRTMHDNSLVRIETLGLETDAFLVAEQRALDGTLLSLAIHNGSVARRPDRVLFSSLLKGDLRIVHEAGGVTVHSAFSAPTRIDFATGEGSRETKSRILPAGAHATRFQE